MDLPAGQFHPPRALSANRRGKFAGAGRHGLASGGHRASPDQFHRQPARRLRTLRTGGGTGGPNSRRADAVARAVQAVPGAGLRAGDA